MPTLRFSLATLLAIVAVIALGLAGLTLASPLATAATATVTLAVLLAAIVAACLLTGIDRAFWLGFALFGWTYLVLVNWDWVGGQFGHDLAAGLGDFAERLVPELAPGEDWQVRQAKVGNVVQIIRMLLSLLFALAGGFIAGALARRRASQAGSAGPAASG
jgi:hypothetical protein